MKRSLSALVILSTAASASATPVFYDGFDYPLDVLRLTSDWVGSNTSTPRPTVVAGSLTYPGVPTSVGNSVQLVNANGTADRRNVGTVTSGTLYYSFIVKLSAINDTAAGISGTGGAFFAGFDDHTSGTTFTSAASLLVRRDAGDTTKYNLGIGVTGLAGKSFSGAYDPSDTLFVVGSFTFGAPATLDIFANGQTIPSSAPAVHTLTSTVADTVTTQLLRFYVRQNTGEPSTINIDEVRVGVTWNDVAPLGGDANLNGHIDPDDYALIDQGYARYLSGDIPATTAAWANGDFNTNGVIDASDYLIIDQNFLSQGGSFSPETLADRAAQFGDGYVATLMASVPEPASLGLFGVGLLGAVTRRRRGTSA